MEKAVADKKSVFHRKLNDYLRPGGIIILEAFSKKHLYFNGLDPKVGGPKEIDMLYSEEEITADFGNYEMRRDTAERRQVSHGKGAVIRFVGRKIN